MDKFVLIAEDSLIQEYSEHETDVRLLPLLPWLPSLSPQAAPHWHSLGRVCPSSPRLRFYMHVHIGAHTLSSLSNISGIILYELFWGLLFPTCFRDLSMSVAVGFLFFCNSIKHLNVLVSDLLQWCILSLYHCNTSLFHLWLVNFLEVILLGWRVSLKQSISHFSPKVRTESKKQIGRKWRNGHLMRRRNTNLPMRQLYSQR